MIKFQLWLRRIFGISKSESTGFIIFLPLVLLLIFIPAAVKKIIHEEIDFSEEEKRLNMLIGQLEIDTTQLKVEKFEYKMFDPNTISEQELQLMGVNKVAASNWGRYLASGGRFNSAEDVKKIYGLGAETFTNLRDYINIRSSATRDVKQASTEVSRVTVVTYTNPKKWELQPFDLNKADTVTLKRLKGIGSVYAKRIVKYRESLGGFTSIGQLKEVWGLNDTVLKQLDTLAYIEFSSADIRFLPINDATEQELGRHPYLSNKQASAIVAYRYQHGKLHQVSDLYNIHRVDSLTIAKISPYLEF